MGQVQKSSVTQRRLRHVCAYAHTNQRIRYSCTQSMEVDAVSDLVLDL